MLIIPENNLGSLCVSSTQFAKDYHALAEGLDRQSVWPK